MKKVWTWLNGKKTSIGMGLILVSQGLEAFLPSLLQSNQTAFILTLGSVIGGFGMIHKGAKSQTGQNLLTKIKPKKN